MSGGSVPLTRGGAVIQAGLAPPPRPPTQGGRAFMSGGPVRVTRDGAVIEVVLARPKANAIDAATSRAMGDVFAGFRDDTELRVAIITGAGEKFFSAGWDLKAAAQGEPPDADYGVGGFGGLQQLPNLNKPMIAAG